MSSLMAQEEDAQTKFWRIPKLIERLLEYLDEFDVLAIIGLKLLAVEVFQAASATAKHFEPKPLRKIIRKALRLNMPSYTARRENVQRVATSLLAQLPSPDRLLMEVLETICAEYKYVPSSNHSVIRLGCPEHKYHSVTALGFILLEDCEKAVAIGSTKQRVRKIELARTYFWSDMRNPLELSLVSRMGRQGVAVETLSYPFGYDTLQINSLASALTFQTLSENCDQLINLNTVKVHGKLGTVGWEALGKAMKKHPCRLIIYTLKGWMVQATPEELRMIWQILPTRPNGSAPSFWHVKKSGQISPTEDGRKFFKACEGPRAEEISETNWAKLLDFLEEPEELKDLPGPKKLRSGKELDES